MSDPVSALNGKTYSGSATVTENGLCGMIVLRGTFTDTVFQQAVRDIVGCDVPDIRKLVRSEIGSAAWMSPDELLLLVDYSQTEAKLSALRLALAGTHFMAENVSDARACFTVTGAAGREVLAKIAPVDLSPVVFKSGDFRRTRFAQIAAAFWLDEADTFHIICFRSVAEYMFNLLKTSAHPNAGVGVY